MDGKEDSRENFAAFKRKRYYLTGDGTLRHNSRWIAPMRVRLHSSVKLACICALRSLAGLLHLRSKLRIWLCARSTEEGASRAKSYRKVYTSWNKRKIHRRLVYRKLLRGDCTLVTVSAVTDRGGTILIYRYPPFNFCFPLIARVRSISFYARESVNCSWAFKSAFVKKWAFTNDCVRSQ